MIATSYFVGLRVRTLGSSTLPLYQYEKGYGDDEVDLRVVDISECLLRPQRIPLTKHYDCRHRQGPSYDSTVCKLTHFLQEELLAHFSRLIQRVLPFFELTVVQVITIRQHYSANSGCPSPKHIGTRYCRAGIKAITDTKARGILE